MPIFLATKAVTIPGSFHHLLNLILLKEPGISLTGRWQMSLLWTHLSEFAQRFSSLTISRLQPPKEGTSWYSGYLNLPQEYNISIPSREEKMNLHEANECFRCYRNYSNWASCHLSVTSSGDICEAEAGNWSMAVPAQRAVGLDHPLSIWAFFWRFRQASGGWNFNEGNGHCEEI